MKRLWLIPVVLMLGIAVHAQTSGADILGSHNLSASGTGPVKGQMDACLYCHAPHSGVGTPNGALWSQTLSVQTYTDYSSTTMHNTTQQPMLGAPSTLCLSCHDGTVAVGQTQPYGNLQMTGNMIAADVFGSGLQGSHPFSLKLPMVDAPDLVPSLASTHTTADPLKAVTLINNNVECNSCHTPHAQAIDTVSQNFLVRDGSSGQVCLACHEPDARTVSGQTNPLAQWSTSIHAQASNKIANAPVLGSYPNVAQNACISCHMPHNSLAGPRLLRGPVPAVTNMDASTQNCMTCHNGGSNISPAIPNVYAEFAKIAHPYPSGNNSHDSGEPPLLINNRHATCVDCHSPHASLAVTSFSTPLPPVIRGSQNGVAGISGTDGTTILNPAVNQFENCLRCHGTSSGKQSLAVFGYLPTWAVSSADPLNVINQMTTTSTSSHPVLHDRSSALAQPSLLSFMWNLDGRTQGRAMSSRILCTDCHNSDDNREFGGTGPNGPHGSVNLHLLERRYEFSQVAPPPAGGPGTTILNLFPSPVLDPAAGGPYSMCAKCHDLNQVISNTSFSEHARHINDGFSCSTCHTSHGMGAPSANISGERMVNFDINVVAPNGATPVSYSRATNSCSLTCHNHAHSLVDAAGAQRRLGR
ncbi:MAG TPA: cytochrome c3 family protein [Candidatus Dormibacteraeota bacterium]|nr:cytochrome c3 family protein [Candidatus Dormibacteraeota bacterium]